MIPTTTCQCRFCLDAQRDYMIEKTSVPQDQVSDDEARQALFAAFDAGWQIGFETGYREVYRGTGLIPDDQDIAEAQAALRR